MAKDSNELGTTLLPGGLDISVPDLTVARPVDTLVEFNGVVLRSTDAVSATYVAVGGQDGTVTNGGMFGAQGGSFAFAIAAGAETASLLGPTSGGMLLSIIATSDGGGSMAITSTILPSRNSLYLIRTCLKENCLFELRAAWSSRICCPT